MIAEMGISGPYSDIQIAIQIGYYSSWVEMTVLNRVSDHPTSQSGMHICTLEVRAAPYV
jgi:hypothetical protein